MRLAASFYRESFECQADSAADDVRDICRLSGGRSRAESGASTATGFADDFGGDFDPDDADDLLRPSLASTVDRRGVAVDRSRFGQGDDPFWEVLSDRYCRGDRRRRKMLAAFVLHELAGWTVELLGETFAVNKGNVSRWLHQVRGDLRRLYGAGEHACPNASPAAGVVRRAKAKRVAPHQRQLFG
jgi:hypothetical protein